jgi:hypothetical protein
MTEWLLLLLLVPAIVVPVVLLFGFAGCSFEHGIAPDDPPAGPILTATPKGPRLIELTWTGVPPGTVKIHFVRTMTGDPPLSPPPVSFERDPSPAVYPDNDRLFPATPYTYKAQAVLADGGESKESSVNTMTLALEVTFDGTGGAGNTGNGTNLASTSWLHTPSGTPGAVVVGLRWAHNGPLLGAAKPTRTVTYGGTTMTSLGVIGLNDATLTAINGTYHELFGLLNPLTGAQTVAVSVSRPNANSIDIEGCSVSYAGVSAFAPVPSVFGTEAGTLLSQTVSSAAHEMVVQMFTTSSGPITGYNKTLRFDGGPNGPVIGDAQGAASVQFTASRANSVDYAGVAVRLTPG